MTETRPFEAPQRNNNVLHTHNHMSTPNDSTESDQDDLQAALLAAFGDDANEWLEDDDQLDDAQLDAILDGEAKDLGNDGLSSVRALDAVLEGLTAELQAGTADAEPAAIEQSDVEQDAGPRHAVFEVGDHVFGIPLTGVREIDRCGKVTVLPRTPAWLRGVTNLRGQILSVTDFRNLLDLPDDRQSTSEKIIVVHSERHNTHTALVVDRVLGIRSLSGERKPLAGLSDRIATFADSVSVTDQATTVLIDPDELLGCDELTRFNAQR